MQFTQVHTFFKDTNTQPVAAWLSGKTGKREANLKRSGAMRIMILGGALPSGIQQRARANPNPKNRTLGSNVSSSFSDWFCFIIYQY